jgi:hypothetical protein
MIRKNRKQGSKLDPFMSFKGATRSSMMAFRFGEPAKEAYKNRQIMRLY